MTKIFKKLTFNKKVIKKYMKKLVNWIKMKYILKKNIFLYQTKIKIKQSKAKNFKILYSNNFKINY